MSGPTSNEVAEVSAADPVVEVTANVPDAGEDSGTSFMDALDAAFAGMETGGSQAETTPDPAPEPEPEPEIEAAAEPEPEPEPEQEAEAVPEPEAVEDDTPDPLADLSEDIGDDWTPKAASRFKQLKEELRSSNTELQTLRQQQQEYEKKVQELTGLAENNDVQALQQKVEKYEQAQMFSDLEQTEAYQQAVAEPLQIIVEQAAEIAEKYGADADALIDVMSMSDQDEQDSALNDILHEANDRDRASIYNLINNIDPILSRRNHMWENAEAAFKEAELLAEQKSQQEAAEKLRVRQEVAQNVAERVQQKLPFLSGVEGLDMKAIQEKAAEVDPSVMHPVDFTFNSISAQLLPTVVREFIAMRAENAALTDRLAEYEDAEPTMSGNAPTSGQVVSGAGAESSFEDAINAAFGSRNLNR